MTGEIPTHPAEPVTRPAASSVQTAVRFTQLVGDVMVEWSAVEVDATAVPGAQGPRCLVFTRTDCIRRVWHYPPDWRTLGDAELAALSWQR